MCVRVYVYIYECSWIDSLKFVYYSWRVISIFQTYFLFIRSLSRFPTQQLISLRFRNIYLYRRKGAGKFQFLSVLFFSLFKTGGTRREIFLFHRNDVYRGGVERFPCHSKGSSYLLYLVSEPGFRSSVCKSVDTYLRGASCLIFIPERLVPRSNRDCVQPSFRVSFPPLSLLLPPRPRCTRSSWTFGRIFDAYPTLITLHGVSTEGWGEKSNEGLSSKANCQLRARLAEGKITGFSIAYVSFIFPFLNDLQIHASFFWNFCKQREEKYGAEEKRNEVSENWKGKMRNKKKKNRCTRFFDFHVRCRFRRHLDLIRFIQINPVGAVMRWNSCWNYSYWKH